MTNDKNLQSLGTRIDIIQVFKEFLIVYATSLLSVFILSIFITVGHEGSGKGWVEAYVFSLFCSSLVLFLLEKKVSLKLKLLGTVIITILSAGIMATIPYIFPIKLVGITLLLGFPIPIITGKFYFIKIINSINFP